MYFNMVYERTQRSKLRLSAMFADHALVRWQSLSVSELPKPLMWVLVVMQLAKSRVTFASMGSPRCSPALHGSLVMWSSLILTQQLPQCMRHCCSVEPCAMTKTWTARKHRTLCSRCFSLVFPQPFTFTLTSRSDCSVITALSCTHHMEAPSEVHQSFDYLLPKLYCDWAFNALHHACQIRHVGFQPAVHGFAAHVKMDASADMGAMWGRCLGLLSWSL